MTASYQGSEREQRNSESANHATHHAEPWDGEEVTFLLAFFADAKGDRDAEAEVAEALGRTIEACRQMFYEVRSGRRDGCGVKIVTTTTTTTTRTTTTAYIGCADDDEDRWWDPSYYETEKGQS